MESLPQTPREQAFERLKESIQEQWNAQIKVLTDLGIVGTLPPDGFGMLVDNIEYPVPDYHEILERIEANREMLSLKAEQGFTKILLTPFGYSMEDLIAKYKETIREKATQRKDGKLLATGGNPDNPTDLLEVDMNAPVYNTSEYTDGSMVYGVKEFSANHQGKTKQELLALDPANAWSIDLIEDMPNIPRAGQGQEVGGRHQLEAGKSPNEYLQTLQTPQYLNEEGLTPEAEMMLAIYHLQATGEVSNDYDGKGSISLNLGAYMSSGDVPCSFWGRYRRRAYLNGYDPRNRSEYYGVRVGVRV
jgi:hypothetical protein